MGFFSFILQHAPEVIHKDCMAIIFLNKNHHHPSSHMNTSTWACRRKSTHTIAKCDSHTETCKIL